MDFFVATLITANTRIDEAKTRRVSSCWNARWTLSNYALQQLLKFPLFNYQLKSLFSPSPAGDSRAEKTFHEIKSNYCKSVSKNRRESPRRHSPKLIFRENWFSAQRKRLKLLTSKNCRRLLLDFVILIQLDYEACFCVSNGGDSAFGGAFSASRILSVPRMLKQRTELFQWLLYSVEMIVTFWDFNLFT